MPGFEQVPFGISDFADNPEPRCPCLLLLDTSSSMSGRPISELNAGLAAFKDELIADSLASKRVEIGIVSFGPVQVVTDFQTADVFIPPQLIANGNTPMGGAISQGIEMLRRRKEIYQANGISYYRPWIFLITDGEPTDDWRAAAALVREGEEKKNFKFFPVGVEGANMGILAQISKTEPIRLKGLQFRDLFNWLSNSLGSVSHSQPGDMLRLPPPTGPQGWGTIEA